MYPDIKYIFLISTVCAGFLLSACSSDIPNKKDPGEGAKVSFTVPNLSRASLTADIDCFSVFGDTKSMGETPESPKTIFDKTEVIKSEAGWQYQGDRYWFPDQEHSFIAIHPLSVLESAQYADSKLTFTYSLPISNDDAADIITATHRRLYRSGDTVSPISLQFGHLLSLINFSIELTDPATKSEERLKIHKLEITGFGTSATINIKPAQRLETAQTGDSEIDFVTAKDNGSLKISFGEPLEVTKTGTATKMFDSNHAIIMLPQKFTANEEVKTSLTYSINDEEELIEVSATLKDFAWESGNSYEYKIKLELDEAKEVKMVISQTSIAPWNLKEVPNKVEAR